MTRAVPAVSATVSPAALLLRRLAACTVLALLPLLEGCYAIGETDVVVTSTPAGGRIYLDGTDTGLTTPAVLDMESFLNISEFFGSDLVITVRKNGFDPEKRIVHHHTNFYTSNWFDGATSFWFLTFPLFWTFGDFFAPIAARWAFVPHEVHVVLYPTDESPGVGASGK